MKFEFITTNTADTIVWNACTRKLENDLHELIADELPEEKVTSYLIDMIRELKPASERACHCADETENDECALFLMYDDPASMPADARVEFVYRPTYIAATILMTAINRYDNIAADTAIRNVTRNVLKATLGRNFVGTGYDEYNGLIETLRIFAQGDTASFLKKYRNINELFACRLEEAFSFLETDICTGKIRDVWSGEDYSEKGNEVLAMYRTGDLSESEHVWYACYGSNMSRERFMIYINKCSDKRAPIEDRPFLFEHSIYFAKTASGWSNGGKAFLDDSCPGSACGRIYKITKEQFEQVQNQEGPDYKKKVYCGMVDGIPVYSFTDMQKNNSTKTPSNEYFATILAGLKECYGDILSNTEVDYLIGAIFPENAFSVARAILKHPHYLTNIELSEITGLNLSKVVAATAWLVEHNVIQQDRRSVHAGHHINDAEAYFFTVDSPCGRALIAEIINALEEDASAEIDVSAKGRMEGTRRYVLASRIERDVHNRINAIKLHGYRCQACGFDFVQVYGELGRNYIEVHHVNPLAEQDGEHVVDPETDLVCLCANCHRMVHRNRSHVLSVDELKEIINNR